MRDRRQFPITRSPRLPHPGMRSRCGFLSEKVPIGSPLHQRRCGGAASRASRHGLRLMSATLNCLDRRISKQTAERHRRKHPMSAYGEKVGRTRRRMGGYDRIWRAGA